MRKTFTTVAAVAALGLLTACSGGGGETGGGASPEETAAAGGDSGSLTIWTDENRQPAIEAAAEAFTEETDVEVETVVKNFEDIRADFLAQVPTGEGPDITVGAHDWLGALIVNGVVDSVDLGDKAGDFEDVAIQAFTYEGQLYGMPYALETVAVVRNTELAPNPTPATFDEMIAAGRAAGTKLPFVINTNGTTGDAYTYYGLQTSFGAPVFVQNEDGSYTTELGMANDGGYQFAEFLKANGMGGAGVFSTDWTYDIANQEFADGNAPFTIAGPWAIADLTANDAEVAVEPIPSAGGQPAQPFVGVQGFYISAQSENKLLAADFLTNYVATPDAMMAIHEADPRIPAFTETADAVSSDPVIAGFLESSKTGVPMPSIPEMGDVWEFWNGTQASLINGSATDSRAAWDKMVTDLQGALGG